MYFVYNIYVAKVANPLEDGSDGPEALLHSPGGKLHIQNSELFQFYLGQNNSTEGDLAEIKESSSDLMDSWLVGSMFTWKAWVPSFVLGIFGMLHTDFGSTLSSVSIVLICVGLLGAIPLIHAMIMDIAGTQRPKVTVLDKPRVSMYEYSLLSNSLSRILDTDESILYGLTIEELQELATKELRKQALDVVTKQQRNDSAHDEKRRFRESHATMYKLGIASAHWDKYFPSE
jgi:hypothetical protein